MPLKQRFFLKYLGVLSLCIIVPLSIFAYSSVYVLHSFLLPLQERGAQMMADRVATTLGSDFHEFETFVISSTINARPKSIITRLLSSQSFAYEDLLLLGDMKDQISTIKNRRPYIQEIAVWFPNEQRTYLSDSGKREIPFVCPWLDSFGSHASSFGWWTVMGSQTRFAGEVVSTIYLCHRVGSDGMVSFLIDPVLLSSSLAKDFPGRGEVMSIFSEEGRRLLATGEAPPDDSYLTYVSEEENTGWKVSFSYPKAIVFELADGYKVVMVIFISFAFLVSLLFALCMARRNTRQISLMLDMIHASQKGLPLPKLHDSFPRTTYAYISQHLLASFLEQNNLKNLLERRRYKLVRAELVAMQSQLNPHFLYNTLETLNWDCYQLTGSPNQATDIIEKLSDILHYSLGKEGLFVTLSQEMEYLDSYLDILSIRHKGLFSYHKEVPDELSSWRIPRMILQPLVENAILHGLKLLKKGGVVRISASRSGDSLLLSVRDNGVGIPSEKLFFLRSEWEKESLGVRHLGLANVNLRLAILYGTRLEIESVEGEGTEVRLCIPKKEKSDVPVDDC